MGGRRGKRSAPTDSPTPNAEVSQTPIKKQKRDEYKAATGGEATMMPKKKWFRQRAHANPFSDHQLTYPTSPQSMDWSAYYPAFVAQHEEEQATPDDKITAPRRLMKHVEIADIGCGFGGLLFALASKMPDTLMLGLEIRTSVTEFVQSKVRALRQQQAALRNNDTSAPPLPPLPADAEADTALPAQSSAKDPKYSKGPPPMLEPGSYNNIAALRANTMKFLPNFFPYASLSKIFLCFPDPHFKTRKHKARIVSSTLTSEYAFVLRPGGKIYTITDVEDLASWMRDRITASRQFEEVREGQREEDICVSVMREETEEGKKVGRNGGSKFVSVWRRLPDPPWPGE